MHISYQVTKQDLLSLRRYSVLKPPFLWVFLLQFFSLPIFLIFLLSVIHRHLNGSGITIVVLYEAYLIYSLFFRVPTKAAKQTKGFFEDREATFNENGFTLKGGFGESTMSWDVVYKFVERKHYFYLYINSRAAHVIPKRAFASEQQIEEFRQLVIQSIGKEKVA